MNVLPEPEILDRIVARAVGPFLPQVGSEVVLRHGVDQSLLVPEQAIDGGGLHAATP